MRTRDQHHTWAESDQPENRAELQPNRDRTDDTREQRSAEGLRKQIVAHPGPPPTKAGTRAGAEPDQDQAEKMGRAEDHAERRGSGRREQGEARDRDDWK